MPLKTRSRAVSVLLVRRPEASFFAAASVSELRRRLRRRRFVLSSSAVPSALAPLLPNLLRPRRSSSREQSSCTARASAEAPRSPISFSKRPRYLRRLFFWMSACAMATAPASRMRFSERRSSARGPLPRSAFAMAVQPGSPMPLSQRSSFSRDRDRSAVASLCAPSSSSILARRLSSLSVVLTATEEPSAYAPIALIAFRFMSKLVSDELTCSAFPSDSAATSPKRLAPR
mmetsp:Transcript_9077/g.26754  ORF Transcript_9077/g.26754 Transcript_9077/m.26754 type:complete len:231 (-) Transcript_9077:1303-1995(-)